MTLPYSSVNLMLYNKTGESGSVLCSFFFFFCTWDYLRLALRSVGGDWPCRWRPRCAQVRGLEVWHGRLLVDFLQSVSVDSKREGFWRQLKVWQNT